MVPVLGSWFLVFGSGLFFVFRFPFSVFLFAFRISISMDRKQERQVFYDAGFCWILDRNAT
jgi:hypothetical protein